MSRAFPLSYPRKGLPVTEPQHRDDLIDAVDEVHGDRPRQPEMLIGCQCELCREIDARHRHENAVALTLCLIGAAAVIIVAIAFGYLLGAG